jgi:aminotransferase
MRISHRVNQIEVSAIKRMPLLAAEVEGCVSLGQGIPSFTTPSHVVEAVCQAFREESWAGKYSLQPGLPELRQAVAKFLRNEKAMDFDPITEVGITAGAMEALLAAFLTLVERGDEVIVTDPTYEPYLEQILLAEGVSVFVPLNRADWGLDVELVEAAITDRTKAIVLCNPANPTGRVFSDDEVRALVQLALERDLYLISDETYEHLVYDGPAPLSPAAIDGMRERVISVFSFSKKYAMTGWRVGFVAAPNKIMAELMKVHDAAVICAPTPSQLAALAALSGPQGVVDEMRRALADRRELICSRLDRLDGAFSYIKPQGAYYLMARYHFTEEPSWELAVRLINEARVITVPGGSFGPSGEGHLRLSFGGNEAELNEAFDRLERWLGDNFPKTIR